MASKRFAEHGGEDIERNNYLDELYNDYEEHFRTRNGKNIFNLSEG